MPVDFKDLIAWAAMLIAGVGQFFHLKGRVTLIEARQKDLRADLSKSLDKIDQKLERIEGKLDGKADK